MGALLAVPLTMIVKEVVLDAYDDTRGLADLMSANSPGKNQRRTNQPVHRIISVLTNKQTATHAWVLKESN